MGVWNRLKNYLLIATIGGASLSTGSCEQKNNNNTVQKVEVPKAVQKPVVTPTVADTVSSPTLSMPYRTDTLETAGSTLLLYINGSVKRYYVEKNNSFRMQLPYFAHEWWHHHNNLLKYRTKYKLQPEEYYKLCCHDEITANLTAILTARYEYMESQNKQAVIDKYKGTYMDFYFRAIESKEINPFDNSAEARKAEWSLLVNGTRQMWMKLYYPVYAPSLKRQLSRFIGRLGFSKSKNKNYEFLCSQMYTIGGVDFTKYADFDIDPNAREVSLINDIGKIKSLGANGKDIVDVVNANYQYLSGIGTDDQKDALQNLLISSKLKLMLRGVSESDLKKNPQIVTRCYEKIWNDLQKDPAYENLINEYCGEFSISAEQPKSKLAEIYRENVKQMYFHNNTDLTSLIENFAPHRMPVQTKLFDNDKEQSFYHPVLEPLDFNFTMEQLDVMKQNNQPLPLIVKESPQPKERVSDMQYIDIPNFFEPILTSSTPEQQQQIYQIIKNFNDIPDVLKNCDTLAQIEYKKAQARVKHRFSKTKGNKSKRSISSNRRSSARTK